MSAARIDDMFRRLAARRERALITYVTVGDPDLATSVAAARAMLAGGADMVELGVPYSDPLADGPTIQAAGQRALSAGFRLPHLFEALSRLRAESEAPLAVMTYVNPVMQFGTGAFARESARAGADALLVPDLPPEESAEIVDACRSQGLAFVPFVAPTSTEARIRAAAACGDGFVYCVSVTGVTGARKTLPPDLPDFLGRVRQRVELPVCVGFGVGSPEQARSLAPHVDGVVVASALVEEIAAGGGADAIAPRVGDRVSALKEALREVHVSG